MTIIQTVGPLSQRRIRQGFMPKPHARGHGKKIVGKEKFTTPACAFNAPPWAIRLDYPKFQAKKFPKNNMGHIISSITMTSTRFNQEHTVHLPNLPKMKLTTPICPDSSISHQSDTQAGPQQHPPFQQNSFFLHRPSDHRKESPHPFEHSEAASESRSRAIQPSQANQ